MPFHYRTGLFEAIFGISAKFPSYLVGLFEHVKNSFFDEPRRRYVRGECGWMMGYGGCSEGCIHTAPSGRAIRSRLRRAEGQAVRRDLAWGLREGSDQDARDNGLQLVRGEHNAGRWSAPSVDNV